MFRKPVLVVIVLLCGFFVSAQEMQRHKIALFTPLYLDSAYDAAGNYRFDKTFPKYINPGLEFYMGAQYALDSLNKAGAPIELFVYDTKSVSTPVAGQLNHPEMNDVEMVIGHTNSSETRILAEFAERKKLPFISATLPNDAGVTSNPYYVVLNSTLRSHCTGIYRFLQKYHSLDKITVFTKPGSQENQIAEYLNDYANATSSVPLKIKFKEVGMDFTAATLAAELDSNTKNVCIAGSLDEAFGNKLLQQLSVAGRTYPLLVVGMPTWDAFNFSKSEYRSFEIIYSTPFNYSHPNALGTRLTNEFSARQQGRPTDMFFRGYETMMRFGLLLLDAKKDVSSSLSRRGNNIFTSFDIQPVFLDRKDNELDYFENKNLYFIRWANGTRTVQY